MPEVRLPALTFTSDEVWRIARLYGDRATVMTAPIERATLVDRIRQASVVHIAAHALANRQQWDASRLLVGATLRDGFRPPTLPGRLSLRPQQWC